MAHRKLAFLIATCLVCLAQQQPPTFRATTSLVEVSVVALDAKGDPVRDLKKEEIALTDNGREKELAFLHFEGAPEATSAKPLPPGVFTNRTGLTQGPPRNICAIVIDTLNTPATKQTWARSQAMRYLRTLAPATRVGLYAMGQKMTVLQDFTDDMEALRARIANGSMQSRLEVNMDASVGDAEQLLDSITSERRGVAQEALGVWLNAELVYSGTVREKLIEMSLASLEALGNHLSGIPGRKSLIWISNGISIVTLTPGGRFKSHEDLIRQTAQRLANQGITMYLVDDRGIEGTAGVNADARGPRKIAPTFTGQQRSAAMMNNTLSAMDILAETTGGRVVKWTNDLGQGMKLAASDLRGSYTAGFYTSQEPDNQWHELSVKTKRKGVKLLYRQGYIAAPPAAQSQNWTAEQWRPVVSNPLGSTAVHLDARCLRASDGTLNLSIRLVTGDLQFRPTTDKMAAEVEIAIAEKTSAGAIDLWTDSASLAFPSKENLPPLVNYTRDWKPKATTSIIRLIVRDRFTEKYGTLDLPVKQIPAK